MESLGKHAQKEPQSILKLYEVSKEEKTQQAWSWFETQFFPLGVEPIRYVLAPGNEHRDKFLTVVFYSEMAASLLAGGASYSDLFAKPCSEILLPWVRMGKFAEYVRETLGQSHFLVNLEELARQMPVEFERAVAVDEMNRKRRHVHFASLYLLSVWGHSEDEQEKILKDYEAVCLHTLLGIPSICNLEVAAKHVIENDLAGSYVECGAWRGGAAAYWARSFLRNGGDPSTAHLFCFDSFQGMPRITAEDGAAGSFWLYGKPLEEVSDLLKDGSLVPTGPTLASESDCRAIVEASGFPPERIHIVKGWFQHTLPAFEDRIGAIAVLHLDSDLYEATKFCLETLYKNVLPQGMIIIDDYEVFGGCKQAVDEFIAGLGAPINLIYYGEYGRFFFKP